MYEKPYLAFSMQRPVRITNQKNHLAIILMYSMMVYTVCVYYCSTMATVDAAVDTYNAEDNKSSSCVGFYNFNTFKMLARLLCCKRKNKIQILSRRTKV